MAMLTAVMMVAASVPCFSRHGNPREPQGNPGKPRFFFVFLMNISSAEARFTSCRWEVCISAFGGWYNKETLHTKLLQNPCV